MSILKKILRILLQNGTSIAAIIVGIVSFFSYKGRTVEGSLAYIIALVVLIASTLLIEKVSTLSNIDKNLKSITEKSTISDRFLFCSTSSFWDNATKNCDAVFISGGSLYHVLSEKSGKLEELLKNGRKVEIVLMHPNNDATKFLYNSVVKEVSSISAFRNNILETLAFLLRFKEQYPDTLTIRLNNLVPAFGLMAVYRGGKVKTIQVNFYSEKVPFDNRLSMFVDDTFGNGYMAYEYFCNQINHIRGRLSECTADTIRRVLKSK